nr:MAG TPA: hypothetical protein [Caudoviricetes sp.]
MFLHSCVWHGSCKRSNMRNVAKWPCYFIDSE